MKTRTGIKAKIKQHQQHPDDRTSQKIPLYRIDRVRKNTLCGTPIKEFCTTARTSTESLESHDNHRTSSHRKVTTSIPNISNLCFLNQDNTNMKVSAERVSNDFHQTDHSSIPASRHERKASFSDVERAVLSALFVDEPTPPSTMQTETKPNNLFRSLNDEMLFSVPHGLSSDTENHETATSPSSADHFPKRPAIKKKPKDYRLHVGLWQAHEDGITPKILSRMASAASLAKEDGGKEGGDVEEEDASFQFSIPDDEEDASRSMQRLRGSLSSLSWDEDEETMDHHFDAWQVVKDEYAQELGFDYRPGGEYEDDDSENCHNHFKIIGTSADDKASHPHVVSPPLLDSIMMHLPDVSILI